ncbi:MAG: HEAT repeat domain-containing protein [Verrucomicrobia bacterium]|nr:HEAT repeat domain-containing protein [Verrucomicrobiota bacterium]
MGLISGLLALTSSPVSVSAVVSSSALSALRSVGPEGQGHEAAQKAWPLIAAAPAKDLPQLLAAMDGANDYAMNWIRTAIEAVVQREIGSGGTLPAASLESFLKDTRHNPRARRLAFDLIRRADPRAADALVPGFLNDPGNDLRREAVDRLVSEAGKQVATDKSAARAIYRRALHSAREADQIESLAKTLGDLGEKVDLPQTFGWVTRWRLIGPFDNTGNQGFTQAYPPETVIDPKAEYPGKGGTVRWVDAEAQGDYGMVDFNKPFGALKEVAGYAVAEFVSDKARPAEIRLGCKNGWKVWLNGKFLFGRDEYHTGAEIDQFRLPVQLRAGTNVILVKCTQNGQVEDWTKEWEFQLRVTNAQGTPIRSSR